jgi:putative PIN family toxin of toxin-antitoxin system
MISAVFDATTLLQAATSRKGPAAGCLALVDDGHVRLFLSPATFDEIQEVLNRPGIRRAFPRLTDANVQDFLDQLQERGTLIEDVPAVYRHDRDPDDEPYINLAITTKASFIVSRDNDLLDLMEDQGFCKAYPELAIVDPVAFLKHVRAQSAEHSDSNSGGEK